MDIRAIAARIRAGDKDALRELIAAYGAGVYERAYQSTKDAALAKEATRRTFQRFVSILQANPSEDGFVLLLDMIAGQNIDEYQKLSSTMRDIAGDIEQTCFDAPVQPTDPPSAPAAQQPFRPVTERKAGESNADVERIFREKKPRSSALPVILLVVLSLLLLWLVLGVMMSLKWIPVLDMGYRWFNAHVFPFF